LGVNRARLEFPELQHLVVTLARTWEADTVLIEKASSGLALLQNLQNKTVSPLIPIPVESHKEVRVAQVSPIIEAGRLVLPTEADWLADFEKEILGFPSTRHDDQVDSMTQFLIWITWRERRKSPVRAWLIGGEGVRDLYRERTGIPTFGNNC
jgi:predicted phage terminase large subunit-like protein